MVVVDSSVWIDFFNGTDTPATGTLAGLLQAGELRLVVPDLVLFEVLRGFRLEREHRQALALLESLDVESTGGMALALEASRHYRALRAIGYTVRSAVDVLVASFCIERDYALLHDDRDFEPFEAQRGLKVWSH
ncbi:MAG: PIN domain nuclease [Aquabacterium sp.]